MKKHAFAIIYTLFIILFTIFVILDALVLEKNVVEVEENVFNKEEYEKAEKNINKNIYEDENINISLTYDRKYGSNLYVADIKLKDIKYLKTALAMNKFGRNIEEPTSQIAKSCNAILAINGDFYGFRDYGFVVRNGAVFRDSARPSGRDDALFIYNDGNFKMLDERKTNLNTEMEKGRETENEIYQVFTFGPRLVENNQIYKNEEDKSDDGTTDETRNPRTAIGFISDLHYVIVVADGRSEESTGITISELAEYMLNLKCEKAYNLDGGSSSTMYFNGKVINKPSSGFERGVSDIVYIGY